MQNPERRDRSTDSIGPIHFFIPGPIKAKGRPRFRVSTTASGKHLTLAYTPKSTVSYEGAVRLIANTAMRGRPPLDQPCALTLEIGVQIPASWPKRHQAEARNRHRWPGSKPDLDNLVKTVADACNGITYRDDSLIVHVNATKHYTDTPGVHVLIHPMSDFGPPMSDIEQDIADATAETAEP